METQAAPAKELMNAKMAITSKSFQFNLTRLAKENAADAVPQIEASLLVPNIVAGEVFGSAPIRAGICMSPPPPTAASIVPAQKAKKIKLRMSSHSMSYILINSTNVLAQDAFYL